MLILVKTPFTEYVPNEGMVVGNIGRIVSLPDKMADSRIDAGFGEESTQEAFDAQELSDAIDADEPEGLWVDAESVKTVEFSNDAPKPRGKVGRKPRAAASPVTAPVA